MFVSVFCCIFATDFKKYTTMGELSKQLKAYLDGTPKEQIEKDFFEITCRLNGIDPTSPNAKRKIKIISFKNKYLFPFLRKTKKVFDALMCAGWFMCLGASIVEKKYWWIVIEIIFGIYFLWKVYNNGKNSYYE